MNPKQNVLYAPVGFLVAAELPKNPFRLKEECMVKDAVVIKRDERGGATRYGRDMSALLTVRTQNGEEESFDAGYVTKVTPPKKFVHYPKKNTYRFREDWVRDTKDKEKHLRGRAVWARNGITRKKGKLISTADSLAMYALHICKTNMSYDVSLEKVEAQLKKDFPKVPLPYASEELRLPSIFSVSEKRLQRWIDQNVNRFLRNAKEHYAIMSEMNAMDEEAWEQALDDMEEVLDRMEGKSKSYEHD